MEGLAGKIPWFLWLPRWNIQRETTGQDPVTMDRKSPWKITSRIYIYRSIWSIDPTGGFGKWGYPEKSSIFVDGDFPWNRQPPLLGVLTPFFELDIPAILASASPAIRHQATVLQRIAEGQHPQFFQDVAGAGDQLSALLHLGKSHGKIPWKILMGVWCE